MRNDLPADVAGFVLAHIHSVAQLELLLWMYAHGDEPRTAAEISATHRMTEDMSAQLLEDLRVRGFLTLDDPEAEGYRFGPRNQELIELIGRLAEVYQQRRYSVINLIFSRPTENVRNFARSFRLRKDDEGG